MANSSKIFIHVRKIAMQKWCPPVLGLLLIAFSTLDVCAQIGEGSYTRSVIRLEVTPTWESRTGGLVAADINGDGSRDIVVSQKGEPGRLVAVTTGGEELWSRSVEIWLGEKTEIQGLPGLHGPGIQVGDADADGTAEVIYIDEDGRMILLDGTTGEIEHTVLLPEIDSYYDRWEHAVLADFEDDDDVDVLVQASGDVTGNDFLKGVHIAGYSMPDLLEHEKSAEALFVRHDFHSPGHSAAAVADIDEDGRDEVIGADLVDDDGETLASLDLKRQSRSHIDSYQFGDIDPDRPGLEVAAAKQGGGNEVVLYDAEGIIWQFSRKSASTDGDKVQIGDFDPETAGLEMYLRGKESNDQWVLDRTGAMIADYQFDEVAPESWTEEGVEDIWDIRWTGHEKALLAAKERHARGDIGVYDALDPGTFSVQIDTETDRLYVADVLGDWREEMLVISGNELHIYQNTNANPRPDRERLWNDRTYRLDRATWNYYSP